MKISQTIEHLLRLQAEHGDINVYYDKDWPMKAENIVVGNLDISAEKENKFEFEFAVCIY